MMASDFDATHPMRQIQRFINDIIADNLIKLGQPQPE